MMSPEHNYCDLSQRPLILQGYEPGHGLHDPVSSPFRGLEQTVGTSSQSDSCQNTTNMAQPQARKGTRSEFPPCTTCGHKAKNASGARCVDASKLAEQAADTLLGSILSPIPDRSTVWSWIAFVVWASQLKSIWSDTAKVFTELSRSLVQRAGIAVLSKTAIWLRMSGLDWTISRSTEDANMRSLAGEWTSDGRTSFQGMLVNRVCDIESHWTCHQLVRITLFSLPANV